MKHIISYSGGLGSYIAAKRVVEKYGIENTLILFADTYIEDEDLYRFLIESISFLHGDLIKIDLPDFADLREMEKRKKDIDSFFNKYTFPSFVRLAEGRDVWETLFQYKCINHQWDVCSRFLKRGMLWTYINNNFIWDECHIYLGIDWTEAHRIKKTQEIRHPFEVSAPLCEKPYLTKKDFFRLTVEDGIDIPRLYKFGFQHNNCGGFCIKAGQKQFKVLLENFPDRFQYHEDKEKEFHDLNGEEYSVLRKMKKGVTKGYPLRQLRKDVEDKKKIDEHDWGGCGCALD